MRRLGTVFALVALVITLLSCATNPKRQLAGKWQLADKTETVQFFPDGTITVVAPLGTLSGKFSFPDATHLKLELGGFGALMGPLVQEYSVSGDSLSMTNAAATRVYHRIH